MPTSSRWPRIIRRIKGILAMALLILIAAVGGAQPAAPPPSAPAPVAAATAPASPQEMLERLRALPQQLEGWSVGPETLTALIATPPAPGPQLGDLLPAETAAAILTYRPRWAVRALLAPENPPQPLAVVVLKFSDALGAYGAFAHTYPEGGLPLQIRQSAYRSDQQTAVWRGDFVVLIIPTAPAPAARPARPPRPDAGAMQTAAAQVADLLPLPDQAPLLLRVMPDARLTVGTLRYYRDNVLDLGLRGDGFTGRYVEDNTQLQLMLVRTANEPAARKAYTALADRLASGPRRMPLTLLGKQAQMLRSREYGLCYLMQQGRYVAAALEVHDRDTAEGLLRITATHVRILR
jgi:hypothetical protein